MVTGKPLSLGGSQGRHEATARGALYALREACKVDGNEFEGRAGGGAGASATPARSSRGWWLRMARKRGGGHAIRDVALFAENGIYARGALKRTKKTPARYVALPGAEGN